MKPFLADTDLTLYHGDCLDVLRELPEASVQTCVTSPPYWGLRDYGAEGQLGLESTPDEYVSRSVDVFREVRRVLRDDGTLWLNLGDSYTSGNRDGHGTRVGYKQQSNRGMSGVNDPTRAPQPEDLKPKDLVGIPWRVAFALQQDGWWLRSDIIWSKPNPMPESVTDRPTKAHEYVFLLTKRASYFFDQFVVRERSLQPSGEPRLTGRQNKADAGGFTRNGHDASTLGTNQGFASRNVRSVWTIATQPYPEAHFATFPQELVRKCIEAGCPAWVCRECGAPRERQLGQVPDDGTGQWAEVKTVGWSYCGHDAYRPGVVLDPFAGSGTTLLVARKHGRHSIGIELNADYCELIRKRTQQLSLLDETRVSP